MYAKHHLQFHRKSLVFASTMGADDGVFSLTKYVKLSTITLLSICFLGHQSNAAIQESDGYNSYDDYSLIKIQPTQDSQRVALKEFRQEADRSGKPVRSLKLG